MYNLVGSHILKFSTLLLLLVLLLRLFFLLMFRICDSLVGFHL